MPTSHTQWERDLAWAQATWLASSTGWDTVIWLGAGAGLAGSSTALAWEQPEGGTCPSDAANTTLAPTTRQPELHGTMWVLGNAYTRAAPPV